MTMNTLRLLALPFAFAAGAAFAAAPGSAAPDFALADTAGRTVKLVLTEAKEEEPAFGDSWVKFPAGWKRCMGKGPDDFYGFCYGKTTDFVPFKMPDGRDCTVYPNCTE